MLRFLQIWILHGPLPVIFNFSRLPRQPFLFRWLPPWLISFHLLLLFLLPGGRNHLLGLVEGHAGWLTWMRIKNAFGVEYLHNSNRFLVYKIYHQNNTVLSGYFPDSHTSPSLRFERWAVLSHIASNQPKAQERLAAHLAESQQSIPLSVELFSAEWRWDRNQIPFAAKNHQLEAKLQLEPLGTYNAFTRRWLPKK